MLSPERADSSVVDILASDFGELLFDSSDLVFLVFGLKLIEGRGKGSLVLEKQSMIRDLEITIDQGRYVPSAPIKSDIISNNHPGYG